VPAFKPAYLVHGDDHGRIGERRARLRALAEAEAGAAGIQLLQGDSATAQATAAALSAMTLGLGRRFVIVDGAERWKDSELEALERALDGIDSTTTVAFFAREDGRTRAPRRLHAAVRRVGGDVSADDPLPSPEDGGFRGGALPAAGLDQPREHGRERLRVARIGTGPGVPP